MPPSADPPRPERRFLLLQARAPDDTAGPHERLAFEETLGPGCQIEPWDLLAGPPTERILAATDCVLVGGSGDFGVGDTGHGWLRAFIDLMGDLVARAHPIFASCFGFQAIVVAGGGEVVTDKSRAEVGTFELSVTPAGAADPLFAPLAPRFLAQLGHKDHAVRMPAGLDALAASARSELQALRVPGAPIYATQFHPELSMERNRERFLTYIDAYTDPEMIDPPADVLAGFRPSPGASALLRRYADEVLGPSLASHPDLR